MNLFEPQLSQAQAEALRGQVDEFDDQEAGIYGDELSSLVGGFPDQWLTAGVLAGYVPGLREVGLAIEANHLMGLDAISGSRSKQVVASIAAPYRELHELLGRCLDEIEGDQMEEDDTRPETRPIPPPPEGDAHMDAARGRGPFAFLEELPWGDVDAHIGGFENALTRALFATAPDFPLWEHWGESRYVDEVSVSTERLAQMSEAWRLAYVGRLLRTMALFYGLATEFSGSPLGVRTNDRESLGSVLRGVSATVGDSTSDNQTTEQLPPF